MADLEIELKELEVEAEKQERDLQSEIRRRVRSVFPASSVSDAQIEQAVREYVLPHLEALGRSGVAEIEATTETTPTPEDPDIDAGESHD